jgi:cytochrome c oxidase subunit IV
MSTVDHDDELHKHPEPRKYVFIAVVLAIVTAVEVALYYIDLPAGFLVAALLFFALIKFILVAQWFMHLKFDNRMFKMLFVTGLITAIVVFSVVLIIFTDRGGPSPLITG